MKTNPVYHYKSTASTGIDKTPLGVLVLIEDSDGVGSPKLVRKITQGNLISTSTIADFLTDTTLYKEISGGTTSTIIDGGVY